MGKIQFAHTYEDIISIENILEAWKEFVKGKRGKSGVQLFELRLMEHILSLHNDLYNGSYRHGQYKHFRIADPKPRDIHKASVRDRLLHHVIHRKLYPFFDRVFIADSLSCRMGKGTHKALNRFRAFALKVGCNNTKTAWVLKCDIRKFFANIHHGTLFRILETYIPDKRIISLLKDIVGSFSSGEKGVGLPLGNLTSQLLVNVYMNAFDQFLKHRLKVKYYIRYADDFVILHRDRHLLVEVLQKSDEFLKGRLYLSLHPDKIFIKPLAAGIDFLGWVHFPDHRVLRKATKRRMLKRINERNVNSYLGLCKHGNTFKIREQIIQRHENFLPVASELFR